MLMYEKKLSVIIVNYNVKYFLEQCLYSVRAASQGLDVEIFVVDNHSTDGSVDYLRPLFPEVLFIENEENPGFAKANNQAICQCKGEYVLLLNPDTVIGEESLRTLCYFMDEHPKAGAVGVMMLNGCGVFLPESKRSFPTPWIAFCKLSGLSKLYPNSKRFAQYSLPYLNKNKQHKVEVLAGAFMLVRHEALDKVGLLDEAFFMYGEDIDLSYRIIKGGYKNYYIPERILHYKGESTKHGNYKYIKAFYEAMLIFYKKYHPKSGVGMMILIRTALALKGISSFLFGRKGVKTKPVRVKHRRLLILCEEAHFEKIQTEGLRLMPELEFINLWNLDEERAMDAINRRMQMKGFTDIAFCYPDVSFERMLLFMDSFPNKKTNFHIYNNHNDRWVSAGK